MKYYNTHKITKVDKINTNLLFAIHNTNTSRHLKNLEGNYFQGEKAIFIQCARFSCPD